jgi:hypothetical protein
MQKITRLSYKGGRGFHGLCSVVAPEILFYMEMREN